MTDPSAPAGSAPNAPKGEPRAAVVSDGLFGLIVADFDDLDTAMQAYEELKAATDADRLDIEGVIVLRKLADGTIEAQKATDYSTRRGLTWGVVGGLVVGAIFPPSILASAALLGAAGAGIGRLRHRHNRDELARELAESIDPGHSGLVALVSDPAAIKLERAFLKANRIVDKAIDQAVADDIRAEAAAASATSKGPGA
ncbi:MAG: DUF1269 domain-containing protein [Rubrivivax sp.]|nr:DUF1269 domain-containing protein [Rubrivivax sp.]